MTAEVYAYPSAPTPAELAAYPMNDLGNAQRLIRMVGGRFDDDGAVDTRQCRLLYLRDRGMLEAKPDAETIDYEAERARKIEEAEREYMAIEAKTRRNPYGE